jgi:hypothetical protein
MLRFRDRPFTEGPEQAEKANAKKPKEKTK